MSELTYRPVLYKNLFFEKVFPSVVSKQSYKTIVNGDIVEVPNNQYVTSNPDSKYKDSILIKTNSFGFVSDHDKTDYNKKTVAFLGDSQFAGVLTGNRYSIERALQNCLGNSFFVRNFSLDGQNYKDYIIDYKRFKLIDYDFVFIFINNGDILKLPPQRKRFIPEFAKFKLFYFIQDFLRTNWENKLPEIISYPNIIYVLLNENQEDVFTDKTYITLSNLSFTHFSKSDLHFNRDDINLISQKLCDFLKKKEINN